MSKSIFIQSVIAFIKGDDDQQVALKIQNHGSKGLAAQIAAQQAVTCDFEEEVENAKLALVKARANNGEVITNRDTYVQNLINAQSKIEQAQENLDSHIETIKFLQEQLNIILDK